jgi:hypothetical protein
VLKGIKEVGGLVWPIFLSTYLYKERLPSKLEARHQCLTPIILATQEAEIRRLRFKVSPRQIVPETYLKNTQHKNGLQQ